MYTCTCTCTNYPKKPSCSSIMSNVCKVSPLWLNGGWGTPGNQSQGLHQVPGEYGTLTIPTPTHPQKEVRQYCFTSGYIKRN